MRGVGIEMTDLEYLVSYAKEGTMDRVEITVFTDDIHACLKGMKRDDDVYEDVCVSVIDRDPIFPDTVHFVEHFSRL